MKDYIKHFEQVTSHLNIAFQCLRKPIQNNPVGGSLESFNEYLAHNELELALEELEGLAGINIANNDFWKAMIKASELMDLTEHKSWYESKLLNGR